MNWVEVNGTSLRYELSGSGPTTVVLIHEMGGTLDSWDQVLPALTNSRRVLRYDTRGAGQSEKLKGAVTWDQMADDIAALLDVLNIQGKVSLAGIAVGAAIAAHFAVKYPDRAAALVLHGPATGVTDDRRQATLDRAAAVEANGMRSVVETSLAASYPPVVRHNEDTFKEFRARWLANDPESFAAINRMLASETITDELTRIACPTLVTYQALKDEGAKKVRGARVACALRVLRAFLELDKLDAEVRRRARFLEGNLLAIDERYDEAILAYDRALLRNPALVDGGSPVDRDVAWNRALVLEWRDDAKRDAGAPDGGGPSDGGSSPDGGGSNGDASSPDAGSPDAGSPDGGRPDSGAPSGSPDAGNDAGSDAGSPPKNQADSGLPPDAGPPPPAHGGVSDDDLLDRLSRAPTLQREAIRRQGKQSRGLVDK